MRKVILETEQANQLSLAHLIDDLLLDIYAYMPSSGAYPFAVLRIAQTDLPGLTTGSGLLSQPLLLVLKRTDFDLSDFLDYASQTKEYSHIRSEEKDAFLDQYKHKYQDAEAFALWKEQVTSLGIGILTQLAILKGLKLAQIKVNLAGIDSHLGFHSQHLEAYQLFDVRPV